MNVDSTITSFHQPGLIIDPSTEIARESTRQKLIAVLEAETRAAALAAIDTFKAKYAAKYQRASPV